MNKSTRRRAREARRAIPSEQGGKQQIIKIYNEKIEEKKEIFNKNHKGLLLELDVFVLRRFIYLSEAPTLCHIPIIVAQFNTKDILKYEEKYFLSIN